MTERTFVVMKWVGPRPKQAYQSGATQETGYSAFHVNNIFRMIKRVYGKDGRLICVTDADDGLDDQIIVYPIPQFGRELIKEFGGRFFKLYLFSKEFAQFVQSDFLYLDLDSAVSSDLEILFAERAPLVIMEGAVPTPRSPSIRRTFRKAWGARSVTEFAKTMTEIHPPWCKYNSSVMRITPSDSLAALWDSLDLATVKAEIKKHNIIGTDQAFLHLFYEGDVKTVAEAEGIWHFNRLRRHVVDNKLLPDLLRVVIFPGSPQQKPWVTSFRQAFPWIGDLYPEE